MTDDINKKFTILSKLSLVVELSKYIDNKTKDIVKIYKKVLFLAKKDMLLKKLPNPSISKNIYIEVETKLINFKSIDSKKNGIKDNINTQLREIKIVERR